MHLGVEDGELRVSDAGETELRIDTSGWERCRTPPTIDRQVEATIGGRTAGLRFPPGPVTVTGPDGDDRLPAGAGPRPIDAGEERVRIEAGVTTHLSVGEDASVRRLPRGAEVSLPGGGPVTLGVDGYSPDRRITVPDTPEGIATAITYASATHETGGPARSDPSLRPHPPSMALGGGLDVPDAIRAERAETAIEVRAPPETGALFVLAPLAYYLGARLTIEHRDDCVLLAPEVDLRRELPGLPRLQAEAASLLYRTVTLDCLLREATQGSAGSSVRLLEGVGIHPSDTADRPLAERFAAYLEVPFGDIERSLPDWPLSMYVAPDAGNVPALSHILDRLAFVYLPDATELDRKERLRRSLEDFYRTTGDPPTVEPLLPDLYRGRIHGWLAEGVPIDAFTFLPEAYENRRTRPPPWPDRTGVTVVVNDEEMSEEASALTRIYGDGGHTRTERGLDRAALRAALSRPTEVLHYVGHCDGAGLRCTDGHLSAGDLDRCRAGVFFLNACGSYHEGEALVRQGSVAGAVTLRPVLDDQATRVGATFARLVTRGFTVERSLRIACRRAIMNKDYAVVGDGSYALGTTGEAGRSMAWVTRSGDGYEVTVEAGTAGVIDARRSTVAQDDAALPDVERTTTMSEAELYAFLDRQDLPVVCGAEYYWSDDLAERLRDGEVDP